MDKLIDFLDKLDDKEIYYRLNRVSDSMGSGYSEAVSSIIPFCSENTDIPPFIGKDKYHFF